MHNLTNPPSLTQHLQTQHIKPILIRHYLPNFHAYAIAAISSIAHLKEIA